MGSIADKILKTARRANELADRKGAPVTDHRESKAFDSFVQNAQKAGMISEIKKSTKSGPTYLDGISAFAHSDEFKSYAGAAKGIGQNFEWDPAMKLALPAGHDGTKAPSVTTVSDIRTELTTERSGDIIPLGVRMERLRTFFANVPCAGSAWKALRETGFTNNAAGVPEGVDPATASSAAVSVINTDFVTTNIETIEHAIPFPKELLEDLPGLIAYVRQRGVDGVDDVEDAYIVSGAGAASNEFLGITTDPDVPTYAWSTGDNGDNMADAILMAMVSAMLAEYMCDRTLLSAIDHALIAKMKDSNGQYLFPSAHRNDIAFALWGVPTTKTTALPTGTGITGAFARGAEYRYRRQVTFSLADQHNGDFLKGILWLLISKRAGFRCNRPESFREIDFDNAPA